MPTMKSASLSTIGGQFEAGRQPAASARPADRKRDALEESAEIHEALSLAKRDAGKANATAKTTLVITE